MYHSSLDVGFLGSCRILSTHRIHKRVARAALFEKLWVDASGLGVQDCQVLGLGSRV